MGKWKEYFKGLMGGGVERRVVRGGARGREEDGS